MILEVVQPEQVTGHEQGEADETAFSRRILSEGSEQLQHDKDDNVGVHDVTEPTGMGYY